jgi:pilus biogenesis lipoprotein CpaD
MDIRKLGLVGMLVLGACSSEWDMQGKDPKDVYREQPIKNKIETRSESRSVFFDAGENRLSRSDVEALRSGLRHIAPEAAETVQLQVHSSQRGNQARLEHLRKLLISMGYRRSVIMVEPTDSVKRDEIRVGIDYASVVSPRCPDWRTSPVTTYSNTQQGGWSCAYVNNTGLMVADPRDLQRGSGYVSPDVRRNSEVLTGYHSNSGGQESSGSSSGTGDSQQPQATGP